jgi:hypothetical protein
MLYLSSFYTGRARKSGKELHKISAFPFLPVFGK